MTIIHIPPGRDALECVQDNHMSPELAQRDARALMLWMYENLWYGTWNEFWEQAGIPEEEVREMVDRFRFRGTRRRIEA